MALTIYNIEKLKRKFKVGDQVIVPRRIAHLTHKSQEPQKAEVVGLYPNFFDVKYKEGYLQSIQYVDGRYVSHESR